MSTIDRDEVARQHQTIGAREMADSQERTQHPDAQWFGNAGLGMFIHWGISSVGGESDISWSMLWPPPGSKRKTLERCGPQGPGKILTPRQYWAQATRFTVDRYNPHKWLAAARRAGFTYAVLTTKHHDGFALWPSDFGEFNTRTHLNGRDLVGEYVEACRANGLKVGLYYSPPDWYYNRDRMSFRHGAAKPELGMDHEPITLPNWSAEEKTRWDADFHAYLRGQVEELLTRYGQIDLLWFDGGPAAITMERIRELQPGIVVNGRAHGHGDFETPEGVFPKTRPSGWWEQCHCWVEGGWAYRSHEIYKPTGWAVAELARVRAWGGNFLPSFGPDVHGELPEVAYHRLDELAAWWRHSGESFEGTTGGPWPERCNVPVTCKDDMWYLHVDWVWDGPVEIKESTRRPKRMTLLRSGEAVLWTATAEGFAFELPPSRISSLGEVVKLEWA